METCYRHPNRETGVRCSNCDRPICPDCMTTTPVGMRCPECARQSTKVRTVRSASDEPTLTYLLIGINVLVGIGAVLGGASASGGSIGGSSLVREGGLSGFAIEQGQYYRLLTAGFLHAGFLHLFFNMFSLYILGGLLEPAIGKLRFATIYFVSLLAGSFGALVVEPDALTVGASGAIFGLMGAAVVVMRRRGIPIMESGLGIWILLNLAITFAPGLNISIGGHIGGLIGGTISALIMFGTGDRVRLPETASTVLSAAVGAAAIAGSIAVAG